MSSYKKYRIDLRETVNVSGIRCYVIRPYYFIALTSSLFIDNWNQYTSNHRNLRRSAVRHRPQLKTGITRGNPSFINNLSF